MVNVMYRNIVEAVSARSCGFAAAAIALAPDDTSGPIAGTSAEDKAVLPEEDEVEANETQACGNVSCHRFNCLLYFFWSASSALTASDHGCRAPLCTRSGAVSPSNGHLKKAV